MQFQVPQFIDTEDKIVGPLSLKQFAFVGGGALLTAILYFMFKAWVWVPGGIIIMGAAVALAFVKIEGRPLINVAIAAFHFYWKPQTYVWQPAERSSVHISLKEEKEASGEAGLADILSRSAAKAKEAAREAPSRVASVFSPRPEAGAPAPQPEAAPAPAAASAPKQQQPTQVVGVAGPVPTEPVAPSKPLTRETVKAGSALHKSWGDLQTGAPLARKSSDKQFLDKKMAERYQIFQRASGDRRAAKRIDYR